MTPRRASQRAGRASALLALACMTAMAAPPDAAPQCGPDGLFTGAIELRDFIIPSEPLGGADIPYAAILAPASWTADGGVALTGGQQCQPQTRMAWTVQSTDSLHGIAAVPEVTWVYLATGGTRLSDCVARPYVDARGFLPELLRNLQPAAEVVQVLDRQDLATQASAHLANLPQGVASASAAELRFRVPAPDDKPGRDGLLAGIVVALTIAPGTPETQTTAYAYPSLLALAPTGELDAALAEAVRASTLPNPAWAEAFERANHPGVGRPEPLRLPTTFQPRREARAEAPACARGLRPLSIPNLWIAADGRYYFKEMTSP